VRDAPIDRLIRNSLSAQTRRNPGPCVSENLTAAYLEESLSPEEQSAFESHVADCAACREVFALSTKLRPQEADTRLPYVAPASKRTLFRLSIPIPVLGAVIVAVALLAVVFKFSNKPDERESKVQLAEIRPGTPQVETGVQNVPVPAQGNLLGKGDILQKKAKMMSTAGNRISDSRMDLAETPSAANIPVPTPVVAVPPASVQAAAEAIQPATPNPAETLSSVVSGSSLAQKQKSEAETKAAADQIASIRTQEPVSRPRMFAASNRIATTLYSSPPVEATLKFAFTSLSVNSKDAEAKEIGDRVFYRNSGFWVDKQCVEHSGNPIVEVTSKDPEYEVILGKYPGIRSILPAAIYWEEKNYLLK
jgi:hypothetical protein